MLIRALIQAGRTPTAAERERIIERMATAEFPSAGRHLPRRLADRQWVSGTTEQHYLTDVQRAIRDPQARLALYERRGGTIAAILTDTERVVPEERRGRASLPLFFVAYSADWGTLVTGYQASALTELGIPRGTQWLL